MFSEKIRSALSLEVIGQPNAVNSVVRGVTRLVSRMTPCERTWCAYLFIGPPGTGRAHLVRTLARLLHGDDAVLTLTCNSGGHTDPWAWFTQQLAPLVAGQQAQASAPSGQAPSLVLIQDLESARSEIYPMLARFLETGQLVMPGGQRGQIDNCMIFLTTAICAQEIQGTQMGFTSTGTVAQDEDDDAVVKVCREEAEKLFGVDFLTQLDNTLVFHRLEKKDLVHVVERHFARMSRWLSVQGVECSLEPAAIAFLMQRAGQQRDQFGARDLIAVHSREVEFPMADLLVSQELAAGSRVSVDHRPSENHLHFTVQAAGGLSVGRGVPGGVHEVPIA